MLGQCENCGKMAACNCTWGERTQAHEIIRRREAKERCKTGNLTLVEREATK